MSAALGVDTDTSGLATGPRVPAAVAHRFPGGISLRKGVHIVEGVERAVRGRRTPASGNRTAGREQLANNSLLLAFSAACGREFVSLKSALFVHPRWPEGGCNVGCMKRWVRLCGGGLEQLTLLPP